MMQTIWNENNNIQLHGKVLTTPRISHTSHGMSYYAFTLAVVRLSGAEDRLNIVVPSLILQDCQVEEGEELSVRGEVRSFNNKNGTGSRLVITVYARELERECCEDVNQLRLTGTLCKEPVQRRTPLGREICDMMLAVNRKYGRSDYLPCISWGSLAMRCGALAIGERVELEGRLQSRAYTKRIGEMEEERIAFEISVMEMCEVSVAASKQSCSLM